jgi:site-specific DNA-methyltransferase (adenine-specific)
MTATPSFALHIPYPRNEPDRSLRAQLFVGDAWDVLPSVPPNSIDVVLTSPPYWGQRTYGMDHNWDIAKEWEAETEDPEAAPSWLWYREHGGMLGLEPTPDWYIEHLVEILGRAAAALKPSGSMWVNLGDTYFARWSSIRDGGRQGLGNNPRSRRRVPMGSYRQEKQLLLIPARFAIRMQSRRWILRNDLVWYKPNIPPRPELDRLRLAHEHFFHFVKRPPAGRAKYYYDLSKAEARADDVVTYNVKSGTNGHSATFPDELIRPRIESSCPVGGTLLDPFCGTGRALAVALDCGRSAIGIDINPDYETLTQRTLARACHTEVPRA